MNLNGPHIKEKQSLWSNYKQWTVGTANDGRVFIQDDNFQYDARLYINGNFPNQKEMVEYAKAIAEILNERTNFRNSL